MSSNINKYRQRLNIAYQEGDAYWIGVYSRLIDFYRWSDNERTNTQVWGARSVQDWFGLGDA